MPLDKAILHGKEHRKPYRRAKAVDSWCRNHGRCYWCTMQRLFARKKRERAAQDDMKDEWQKVSGSDARKPTDEEGKHENRIDI